MIYNVEVNDRIISLISIENEDGEKVDPVGGNKGDEVRFTIYGDLNTAVAPIKAAFLWNGKYHLEDVIEKDATQGLFYCYVPPIYNSNNFYLGIYIGEDADESPYLSTNRVEIPCKLSIRDYIKVPQDSHLGKFTDIVAFNANRAETAATNAANSEKESIESAKSADEDAVRAESAADSAEAAAERAAQAEANTPTITQNFGSSVTAVISQKTTTEEFNKINEVVGLPSVIASGIAEAVSPAYATIVIATGISLERGKTYTLKGTATTEAADYGVWLYLKASDGTSIKFIVIQDENNGTNSLTFTANNDYNGVVMDIKTNQTSGLSLSASLETFSGETLADKVDNLIPTDFNADTFVNGDAQFWDGGKVIDTAQAYRVCSKQTSFYKYPKTIHLKALEGFRFSIGYYTGDVFASESGWVTELDIPSNQRFRMMIARTTEDTTETADISEFVRKVIILSKGYEEWFSKVNNALDDVKLSAPIKPFEVLSINHRGYNRVAPENTLPAFKLSKKNGFDFVECDVRFTSDGVPVLLHDASINRTARNANGTEIANTVNIADITYATALTYDFGIHMGEEYRGVKIPTFAEFMKLCRALSLHPYLDVYDVGSDEKAQTIFDIIKGCGMEHNVTIVSSEYHYFEYMAKVLPYARYGIVAYWERPTQGLNPSSWVDRLKNMGIKDIFIDMSITECNHSAYIEMCKAKGVALEAYSPSTEAEILTLDPFVSGITSDVLVAKDVLREGNLD